MQRRHFIAILVLTTVAAVGCAQSTGSARFKNPTIMGPITQAELEASAVLDPLQAVRLLRPGWLHPRVRTGHGHGGDGLPTVYVQNVRYGSVYDLQQLQMAAIKEIRYVDPLDATTRWGIGHTGGVIEVIWLTQARLQ